MGEPSQALTVRRPDAVGLMPAAAEWQLMTQMASVLFRSGLLPDGVRNEQAAVAIVLKGRELGIPAMQAMATIHVINGKPTCSAELIAALIYRDHGDDALIVEETGPERCVVSYKRRSWDKRRQMAYTIEQAQKSGALGGKNPTWQRFPDAMLRARCISAVGHAAFQDSLAGMYTPEELGAEVTVSESTGEQIIISAPAADTRTYDAQTGERVPTPLRTAAPAKPEGGKAQAQRAAGVAAMATAEPELPASKPIKVQWVINHAQSGCQAYSEEQDKRCPRQPEHTVQTTNGSASLCAKCHAQYQQAEGWVASVNVPVPIQEAPPPPNDLDAILDGEVVDR